MTCEPSFFTENVRLPDATSPVVDLHAESLAVTPTAPLFAALLARSAPREHDDAGERDRADEVRGRPRRRALGLLLAGAGGGRDRLLPRRKRNMTGTM